MEEKIRTDARTIRTKTLIRRVLEEMIVEMDARSITVGELTGRAGIHRKTFYLHYDTMDDLYHELADDIATVLRYSYFRQENSAYFLDITHNKIVQFEF